MRKRIEFSQLLESRLGRYAALAGAAMAAGIPTAPPRRSATDHRRMAHAAGKIFGNVDDEFHALSPSVLPRCAYRIGRLDANPPAATELDNVESPSKEVTQLLIDWKKGNHAALDQLTPLVYQELRRLAQSYLRRERSDHTLQATALIHEAYVRLVDQGQPAWESRVHFFGIAAQLMRQILVDHARSHRAAKRGGGEPKFSLDEALVFSHERSRTLVDLDDALRELAGFDDRKSRIVELRYFGGLSIDEIAEAMGISVATVGRELRLASAWLRRAMTPGPQSEEQ